jgi:hypothetical protein
MVIGALASAPAPAAGQDPATPVTFHKDLLHAYIALAGDNGFCVHEGGEHAGSRCGRHLGDGVYRERRRIVCVPTRWRSSFRRTSTGPLKPDTTYDGM